jgi:molecular chaperone GrpE
VTAPDEKGPEQSGPFETGPDGPPQEPGQSPDGPPQGPGDQAPEEGRSPVSKGPETAEPETAEPEPTESATEAEGDELVLAQTALAERTLDLQRLQAEFLNYKRRVERDRDLVRENAILAVLQNMLPVLDDIDRAREHGELEGGFKAVADSLERTVTGLGLTKFGASGDEFDPTRHEALMHGHSPEVTTTTVDVVAHAGYSIGDRVVRAAKVTVLDPEQ